MTRVFGSLPLGVPSAPGVGYGWGVSAEQPPPMKGGSGGSTADIAKLTRGPEPGH